MSHDEVCGEELRRRLARPASRMVVGGFRPPTDPLSSWIGRVQVAQRGENWPIWRDRPMAPVCQINVAELPNRPSLLEDVSFLALFISLDDQGWPDLPIGAPNGEGWLLRAYTTANDLVPVEEPDPPKWIRPLPGRWEPIAADYPDWDDATRVLEETTIAQLDGAEYRTFIGGPVHGTKVGGWPALIQAEIFWAPWNRHPAHPEYVFQVDGESTTGSSWGDRGTLYIGRGTRIDEVWALAWQQL
jgi:hypothetical protein